jgi:hypothetical protein
MRLTVNDQFGHEIEAGKLYGIGSSKASLKVIEVEHDHTRDELVYRLRNSTGPWMDVYGENGALLPKFCILLDADLMEVMENPEDTKPTSMMDRISAAESRVLLLQSELQKIESELCDEMGVVVGDGSDLSDEIMMFVFDPDGSSVDKLLKVFGEHEFTKLDEPIAEPAT